MSQIRNSESLYNRIDKAFESVKEQLIDAGAPAGTIRLFFFAGYGSAHWEIAAGHYPSEEKVKGKHLQECVDELARRFQFVVRQNTLQLGAPTIEGTTNDG